MTFDLWRDLEEEALLEIGASWRSCNWLYFYDAMLQPAFELFDGADLGRWDPATRTISLSRKLVFEERWVAVVEVLKHEMAHQFADEILRATGESAHGPAFRLACARIGLDPRGSGPLSEVAADEEDQRIIQKVSRLLSLATSPNQHEAEAAAVAARRLMLKHNVDRMRSPKRYTFKVLGRPARRIDESLRVLGRILMTHFFVEVVWVREYETIDRIRGTVMEVIGTPANVAIAEYVYGYLRHAARELWTEHRAAGKRKGARRTAFEAGVMYGFLEKLGAQKKSAEEQALVWVKDGDLEAYFRKRHPRTQSISRQGESRGATFEQGKSKGRDIVLRKGVETPASSRGRLLGSGPVKEPPSSR